MISLGLYWIGALSLLQVGVEAAKPAVEDPRTQLATTLPAMVEALEKQEYRRLLEEFVEPADLEEAVRCRVVADSTGVADAEEAREAAMKSLVENFGGRQAKELLAALQVLTAAPPAPPADDRVTLSVEGRRRPLIFVRVGGLWRLKN